MYYTTISFSDATELEKSNSFHLNGHSIIVNNGLINYIRGQSIVLRMSEGICFAGPFRIFVNQNTPARKFFFAQSVGANYFAGIIVKNRQVHRADYELLFEWLDHLSYNNNVDAAWCAKARNHFLTA